MYDGTLKCHSGYHPLDARNGNVLEWGLYQSDVAYPPLKINAYVACTFNSTYKPLPRRPVAATLSPAIACN